MTREIDIFIIGRMTLSGKAQRTLDNSSFRPAPPTLRLLEATTTALAHGLRKRVYLPGSRVIYGPDDPTNPSRYDVALRVPDEQVGTDIKDDVFSCIDDAEIVIADLTSSSSKSGPASVNVMYELALAHCLGIPWIGIVTNKRNIPFYFGTNRLLIVPSLASEQLVKDLTKYLGEILKERGALKHSMNPFFTFYNAHVVDISAAAGLAVGYYENYIRPVLKSIRKTRKMKREEAANLGGWTHLVVVIPGSLPKGGTGYEPEKGLGRDEDQLAERLKKEFPEMVEEKAFNKLAERTCAFLIGGVAVDLARTAYTLSESKRMKRLSGKSDTDRLYPRVIASLLSAFERNLKELSQDSDPPVVFQRLGTDDSIKQIIEEVRKRQDKPGTA